MSETNSGRQTSCLEPVVIGLIDWDRCSAELRDARANGGWNPQKSLESTRWPPCNWSSVLLAGVWCSHLAGIAMCQTTCIDWTQYDSVMTDKLIVAICFSVIWSQTYWDKNSRVERIGLSRTTKLLVRATSNLVDRFHAAFRWKPGDSQQQLAICTGKTNCALNGRTEKYIIIFINATNSYSYKITIST